MCLLLTAVSQAYIWDVHSMAFFRIVMVRLTGHTANSGATPAASAHLAAPGTIMAVVRRIERIDTVPIPAAGANTPPAAVLWLLCAPMHHTLMYMTALPPLPLQVIAGVFQSTGWPSVVAIMANWFGKGKRGLVMGVWNAHTSLGNIMGTVIAAACLQYGWGYAFIVPGLLICVMGLIVFGFLVVQPSEVGLNSGSYEQVKSDEVSVSSRPHPPCSSSASHCRGHNLCLICDSGKTMFCLLMQFPFGCVLLGLHNCSRSPEPM